MEECSTLVFFVGKRRYYEAVNEYDSLTKGWRTKHDVDFEALDHGFSVFKFSSFEESQCVLEGGPWFIYRHPLVLRRWRDHRHLQQEKLKSIPNWVKFPNLMMACRSVKNLSKIASFIGNPICMDHHTSVGTKLAYASVLVEVYAAAQLPDCILQGNIFKQPVEYVWKPSSFTQRKCFNHSTKGCPKLAPMANSKKIWVRKPGKFSNSSSTQEAKLNQPLKQGKASSSTDSSAVENLASYPKGDGIESSSQQGSLIIEKVSTGGEEW